MLNFVTGSHRDPLPQPDVEFDLENLPLLLVFLKISLKEIFLALKVLQNRPLQFLKVT